MRSGVYIAIHACRRLVDEATVGSGAERRRRDVVEPRNHPGRRSGLGIAPVDPTR